MQPPEYTDGYLEICRIRNRTDTDYPEEYLQKTGIKVWFREIAVYDRVRFELEQGGKEITMKVRIPRYKGIDSKCTCIIEGRQHQVYNAAHVVDKNGIAETELTLICPEKELDIK